MQDENQQGNEANTDPAEAAAVAEANSGPGRGAAGSG